MSRSIPNSFYLRGAGMNAVAASALTVLFAIAAYGAALFAISPAREVATMNSPAIVAAQAQPARF